MSNWEVVPPAELRTLAEWMVSWQWPLDEATVVELAGSQGWQPMSHNPGHGARWVTGLVGSRPWARVTIVDGVVSDASVTVSEVLPEKTAESKAFLRDVFADQVALLTELLGPPSERQPGANASARWLLANGAAFEVRQGLSCVWGLTSPEFVQIEADLGRR